MIENNVNFDIDSSMGKMQFVVSFDAKSNPEYIMKTGQCNSFLELHVGREREGDSDEDADVKRSVGCSQAGTTLSQSTKLRTASLP